MAVDVLSYAYLCSEILNKPCTSGVWGKRWQTTMGEAMDVQLDRLYEAKQVGWPDYTPADALYYLAAERGLERVVLVGGAGALEPELDHRDRLRDAWNVWKKSGSADGHRDEMSWMNLRNARVVRRHEFSTPPPAGSPYVQALARLMWSQFDLVLQPPFGVEPLRWGGFTWGDPGVTWGTTATTAELRQIRRVVREHKSAHDTGTYIHFAFSRGPVWGLWTWGDGTAWGGSGEPTVTIVLGEQWWETAGLM